MTAVLRVLRSPWTTKTLAGLGLGYLLGLAVSGLFVVLVPAPPGQTFQLAMWLVAPVWLAVASLVYLFSTAARAWLWLGGATVSAWALVLASRALVG